MKFFQASLPIEEGLAAWAAAAGTAGAILPERVAQALKSLPWENHGSQYPDPASGELDDPLDPFRVLEAIAAACRSVYREDPGHYPMPRGMEVGVAPSGQVQLLWRSDHHCISLLFGEGWASVDLPGLGGVNGTPHWAPRMDRATLRIHTESDHARVEAAVAASPTLQQKGWG